MDGEGFFRGIDEPFYKELRLIAGRLMQGERAVTLSATALLNDVLLECANETKVPDDRKGLRAYCAKLMIHKLISAGRRHRRKDVPLGAHDKAVQSDVSEILRVDEMLESIAKKSETDYAIVAMLLAQYPAREIAEELGISIRQVNRLLARVRAFLQSHRSPKCGESKEAS